MTVARSILAGVFLACVALENAVNADNLDTVTVQAQRDREKLKHDVNQFVASAIVGYRQSNYDSLWRWNVKVCPLVAGVNKAQGEFILARISRIANAVGAPLGSESCKPNYYVVVAPDPALLLKLWWKRNPDLFAGESGMLVRRFIDTPKPIRVWYNAGTAGVDGGFFVGLLDATSDRAHPIGGPAVNTGPSSLGSRLTISATRNIFSVIVIVDSKAIGNLNIGQVSDYVGVAGLAQINFDKNLGDAPSILSLFAASNRERPMEMTTWDQALLHALYHTPQTSRLQLSKMQTEAFQEIARQTTENAGAH